MGSYLRDITAKLVGLNTTSGLSTTPAMQLLAAELQASGFTTALQPVTVRGVDHHNLVAWAGPAAPGGLLLSGHIDTVPCLDQPGWTRDPLALTDEGDRLFGRGVADMKGFLAQCLAAARELDRAALTKPVVLAFTAEEETGCAGAELLAADLCELLSPLPLPTDCWIGEPTSWDLYTAHKGIVALEVTVHGMGGHSSTPQRGVNAIDVAGRVITVVGQLQAELRAPVEGLRELFPDAPCTTLNLGTVAGGTASNMIAERCALKVSYRPLPDGDPLAPYAELRRRLATLDLSDHAGGAGQARIDVSEPEVVPPMRSPADTPLARALEAELGRPAAGGAPYATDGGRFAAAGVHALLCGPGALDQAHQPDESITAEALDRGPQLITSVIRRLCTDA